MGRNKSRTSIKQWTDDKSIRSFGWKSAKKKKQVDISGCSGTSQKGIDTHAHLYHCTTPKQDRTKSTIKAWRVASKLTGTDVKRIHCSDWHAVFPFPDGRILPELIKRQERD